MLKIVAPVEGFASHSSVFVGETELPIKAPVL